MSLAGPTVRRLRLRADSESAVRRAMPALEDAFRTATWPDVGARLVFVRRLALGPLPRTGSTQSLSLALESRFSAMDCRPVHAADDNADYAPAVWFRDPLEAHGIAALRVAGGRPMDAWFWPRVIPALAGPASSSEKLRAIVFSLAAHEEAPAALPAWAATVVGAGHGERLIAALEPGDGEALMRSAGLRRSSSSGRAVVDAAADTAGKLRTSQPPAVLDDRIEFLDAITGGTRWRSSADRESWAGRSDRGREQAATLRHPLASAASQHTRESAAPALVTGAGERAGGLLVSEGIDARRESARNPLSSGTASAAGAGAGSPARRERPPVSTDRQQSPWASPAAVTVAGGLLFLVPALERAGFAEWWNREAGRAFPSDALARHIFSLMLSRLRVADDDPAWQLAAPPRDHGVVPEKDALAGRWLSACRTMLRRRAQIGLASLVVRPAHLVVTATHADVFFPLSAADVRVRRAGLDVDPGWVPWLTKVVTFHYGNHIPRDSRR